jgi:hypothetical protein
MAIARAAGIRELKDNLSEYLRRTTHDDQLSGKTCAGSIGDARYVGSQPASAPTASHVNAIAFPRVTTEATPPALIPALGTDVPQRHEGRTRCPAWPDR